MIKVVHKMDKHDVFIGRPSILGNPYTHLTGNTRAQYKVNTREEAIEMFERYAWERMHQDKEFCAAILDCEGKTVGCFCKPKACHGDCFDRLISRWKKYNAGQGGLWT